MLSLMRGARAMIFGANEDFGMSPVEMMACGRPVIAYGAGGALETVVDGVTGVFAHEQTVQVVRGSDPPFRSDGVRSHEPIRAHAETFSQERFIATMRAAVADGFSQRMS